MDAVVASAGPVLRDCQEVLSRAGFCVGRSLSGGGNCPVILGDFPHLPSAALELVEAGRDVLIAEPSALSPLQIARLFSVRNARQAVYLWSARRHHPSIRLVLGLARSEDPAWRPRAVRCTSLSPALPASSVARWLTLESLALLLELAGSRPVAVSASASRDPTRGTHDFLAISLHAETSLCVLELGLGEALERRELILMAEGRRAYIDELDPLGGVRLSDDEYERSSAARSGAWPQPERQVAQLQCLAFLEATRRPAAAQAEAGLWLRALSVWRAVEISLAERGARIEVNETPPARLRVIEGKGMRVASVLPSLRVVS